MSSAVAYRSGYAKAVWNYVHSGFFARDLEPDDYAFIESIRERGCIGAGPAMDGPTVFLEELPRRGEYVLEHAVTVRQAGDRVPLSQHQVELLRARAADARRQRLAGELELLREQREWDAEERRKAAEHAWRMDRWSREQIEWEEAGTRALARQKALEAEAKAEKQRLRLESKRVRKRRYVPQWQLDEEAGIRAAEERAERERERIRRHEVAQRKRAEASAAKLKAEAELEARKRRAAEQAEAEAEEFERNKEAVALARQAFEKARLGADHLIAPPAYSWRALDWWPPQLPGPGRMFVFEGIHAFCRQEDQHLIRHRFGPRVRLVEIKRGLARFLSCDGHSLET